MRISELIEELSKFDEDLEVVTRDEAGIDCCEIMSVDTEDGKICLETRYIDEE